VGRTEVAPFGSWRSPISSEIIARQTIRVAQLGLDGEDVYWIEVRPSEGGRYVIVRRSPDGTTEDVTPSGFSARTRVHEYGGGSYTVSGGTVFFTHYPDQRMYRQDPGSVPIPISPDVGGALLRYADMTVDQARDRLIFVHEDHSASDREAVNTLATLGTRGGPVTTLAGGHDFYSSPRLSPDGARLAWLSWDHPNLPWDGTELWVADIASDGSLSRPQLVAGGPDESIFQPEWSPAGVLHFTSDRTGWWNLYRWRPDDGPLEALCTLEAEFGRPQWIFGMSTYGFIDEDRLVCVVDERAIDRLVIVDTTQHTMEPLPIPRTELSQLRVGGGRAYVIGGEPTEEPSVAAIDLADGHLETLRRSTETAFDPGYLSEPQAIEFAGSAGVAAHGFYYRPKNRDFEGPAGQLPPLLVKSHGGPTSSASTTLDPEIQFWTSRGFAVVDVNYGGSSSFGRAYRKRLEGQWGVVDVNDCVAAARHLVAAGEVDPARLAIDGGSAGGYTTLCALTFSDVFAAGASFFGIGDLETFVRDTHKFESRYLDRLVGPYPASAALYRERSPVHHVEQLSCPVILFQGLEDRIVPPNQAETMVAALRAKGEPVAYLPFEGEQHGFRKAENIKRALDAEIYFYSRIFGFEPADQLEPVDIENL
jgi:dipeptidyl aminopeptidase/acylaminoacyl peptidase